MARNIENPGRSVQMDLLAKLANHYTKQDTHQKSKSSLDLAENRTP